MGKSRGRGRPITNRSKLGKLMNKRGVRAYEVTAATNICSRELTEYTNARRIIRAEHVVELCKFLDCKPTDIIEPKLVRDLTLSSGVVIANRKLSVKELAMDHLPPPEIHLNLPLPPLQPVAPDRIIRKVS